MSSAHLQFGRNLSDTRLDEATDLLPDGGCVSVDEGYRRWAKTYDLDANPLLALEERHLTTMLPSPAGKRVLDLACGTGRWLTRLQAEGADVGVGIDISAAMLAQAREKEGLANRLILADCQNLPFEEGTFQLVVCSFGLAHLRDLEGVAQEVGRVTSPCADVWVSDLHPQAQARGWRTGFRDADGAANISTWPHSIPQLIAAWNSAGFKLLRSDDCHLDEPERPIFERAGKARLFAEACQMPAVLICRFLRRN